MKLGIVCCKVLETEMKRAVANRPEISEMKVMEWGLHIQPDLLVESVSCAIRDMADKVDAVVLGYGRCQAMDRLPDDLPVPVFRPDGEDCIGVLLGQDRYEKELYTVAGTWFLTPGWTEMGIEFIFSELQLRRLEDRGIDPLVMAKRMLDGYTRTLLIEIPGTPKSEANVFKQKALQITDSLGLKLEKTCGSLAQLNKTLDQALSSG
ncbi:DUF1638 domain-containing protein [Desulfococcaceae bacterium HSG7]|nr:DUF1638 domain-containing protein [Desulfococcaceae bacterium HSG7]